MSKNVFLYAAFKQCCNMYHKRNRVGLSSEIAISLDILASGLLINIGRLCSPLKFFMLSNNKLFCNLNQ